MVPSVSYWLKLADDHKYKLRVDIVSDMYYLCIVRMCIRKEVIAGFSFITLILEIFTLKAKEIRKREAACLLRSKMILSFLILLLSFQ